MTPTFTLLTALLLTPLAALLNFQRLEAVLLQGANQWD